LREMRELFLSRKVKHTFSGYAASQLKRIKGHYRWLKEPPKSQPTRQQYGLPERTLIPADQLEAARAAVQKRIDSWQMDLSFVDDAVRAGIEAELHRVLDEQEINGSDQWTRAARAIGLDDNFIELMDLERRYDGAKKQWQQYQEWKKNRNEARAALEEKWGYDTKHAMHLVRLLRMCREILEGKGVLVKRPDAEELLAIRNGAWTYEALVEWAEAEDKALDEVAKNSSLPRTPPRDVLDLMCRSLIQRRLVEAQDWGT
jgi:predicted nucleotidyltransferase